MQAPTLGDVAGFIGACAAAYGIIKGVPIVETFVSTRLDIARKMHELAAELATVHQELARVYEQQDAVKRQIGAAIVYIGALVIHLRNGGKHDNMPPVPDLLRESVERVLHEQEGVL